MPFLTEELWQALPVKREAESIMVSAYPDADAAWLTDARSARWRS